MAHCSYLALLAVWLALGACLVAAGKPSTTTLTRQTCYTKVATTTKRHVPTTTSIATVISTVTDTVLGCAKTTTITPSPVSVTSTATATATATSTNTAVTDVFTVTTTPLVTETDTSTTTSTTTELSTTTTESTTTSTSTVATPASFTPVASQIADLGFAANQRRSIGPEVANRWLPRAFAPGLFARTSAKSLCRDPHPQSVTCKRKIEKLVHVTVTKGAASRRTVTAAPSTSTVATTTTTTTTITIAPPAVSSTVTSTAPTATSTTTTSTTLTSTTTSTVTETQISTSTITGYGACATNNVVNQISGQYISDLAGSSALTALPITDGVDCCVACQESGCNNWFLYQGTCYLNSQATCPSTYRVERSPSGTVDNALTVGNGICGLLNNIYAAH